MTMRIQYCKSVESIIITAIQRVISKEEISQDIGGYYVVSTKQRYSPMDVQEELLEAREVRDHREFPL